MKKVSGLLLLLLPCCLLVKQSVAQLQPGFSILYRYDDRYMPFSVNGQHIKLKEQYAKLVFTDSVSFFCIFRGRKDPYRKDSVFRREPLHHSQYYSLKTKWLYSVVAIFNHKNINPGYLLADTVQAIHWEIRQGEKWIAGFRCEAALGIKQGTDSVLAWFTRELPGSFGPADYTGLPGVVLDLTELKTGTHLTAVKLEEKQLLVMFPENARLIYRMEDIR